jgi:hypothetical protein
MRNLKIVPIPIAAAENVRATMKSAQVRIPGAPANILRGAGHRVELNG